MTRLTALLLLIAAAAHAQPRGPRRGPPPSAYASCQGAQEGAGCTFSTPRGTEPGSCYYIGDQLACIPADAPRPPSRRADPPPESAYQAEPPAAAPVRAAPPSAAPAAAEAASPALGQTLPAAVAALPLTSAVTPIAAHPEPVTPPSPGFPWTGLFAGIGGAAGIFALWRSSNPQATAPVSAPVSAPAVTPPPPVSRGILLPELPDSIPTTAMKPATRVPAPDPVPAAGTRVGKDYEIRREIGVGGMGVVYEASDLKLDRRVALKKMRQEISKSSRGRERFLAEAKVVAKLQHPNIVTIHGIIEEGDDLYLVFEYVDGETLDDMLGRHTRLTAEQALSVLNGVAAAVDYAHEHKVIHRDLKPANIMIDKSGHAKVMDFGIAHQAKLTISQLTMAEAFGTLAYMPPEQELGKAVRESDVYAFAALTYESLVGTLPFPGPNFHLQKEAMSFTRPSGNFPPLSARLDPVFERAFQVEPKKRYPTTGEFVRTLQGALAASA